MLVLVVRQGGGLVLAPTGEVRVRSDPRNLQDDMAAVMSRAGEVISPGRAVKLEQLDVSELSPDRFDFAIHRLLEGELLRRDDEGLIHLTDAGRAWLAEELVP